MLILETEPVTDRLRVREIDDDEGQRLVRIIRRGTGSVVTWRRAQMVLLSAQGMDVPAIAKVAFTSEDRARDVIRNFNADGFSSLYPKCKGGRPPKFTLAHRREIKKIAKAKPAEYDLPFSTWSLAKLADFLVAEGVVEAVSGKGKEPGRPPRPRMRATYTRTQGVRHLFAAYELGEDKLFGHVKPSIRPNPAPRMPNASPC